VYHSDGEDDILATDDEKDVGPALEVRGGIENERDTDLEKGQAPRTALEKTQTARSAKSAQDSKLVCVLSASSVQAGIILTGTGYMDWAG